ncbi:MAG: hypothetical protein H6564_09880 [Lewinellaceae bacterium]|nr:hypothetical protein [Lewinellaceae bacterium]
MRSLAITFLLLFSLTLLSAQQSIRVAFYNVENLFDLEDDPKTLDEDFTPTGKQQWTAERYQKKLGQLAKVLEEMGSPVLVGLAEVENGKVLEALAATGPLRESKYGIAHFDSPDLRGIDVALLYQKKSFKVLEQDFIRIDFPPEDGEAYTSRDILHVKGKLKSSGDVLDIFVNHWPSRRGGLEASEPRRLLVASKLKAKVDELFAADSLANILIMGDFNDEPENKSVRMVLGAQPLESSMAPRSLYNCFSVYQGKKLGSYNYRGDWNMLDQIIVSTNLAQGGKKLHVSTPAIFGPEWLFYKDSRNGPTPNRTYGGPNYYGGYSDHLPVFVDLVY